MKVGKRWGRRRGEHRLILVFPRGTKHTCRGLIRNRLQCVCVLHGIASTRTPNTFTYLCAHICVPPFLPAPPRMPVHIHMWARICPCCSHLPRSGIGVQRRPLRIGGADLWSASDQAGTQSSREHRQSPTRTHAYGIAYICANAALCTSRRSRIVRYFPRRALRAWCCRRVGVRDLITCVSEFVSVGKPGAMQHDE